MDGLRIGPPVTLEPISGVAPSAISVSASSPYLGAILEHGKVARLSLDSGELTVMQGDHAGVNYIAVSPDGRYLATGAWQGTGVKVWDAGSGRLAAELDVAGRANVTFSPNGRWLLTSTDYEYRIWNIDTWTAHRQIVPPFPDLLGEAACSPDSRLLALRSTRFAVRLVDPVTGNTLATLESPDLGLLGNMSFSPDGTRLAIGGGNMIRVWDLSAIGRQLEAMHLKEPALPLRTSGPAPHDAKPTVELIPD